MQNKIEREAWFEFSHSSGAGGLHMKRGNQDITAEQVAHKEAVKDAFDKLRANETELFKSLDTLNKAEAEKTIEEFYTEAEKSFPSISNPRQTRLINAVEETELDQESKDIIIEKIKNVTARADKHHSRIKNKAIAFAKSLLNMSPEERKVAIEKRDARIGMMHSMRGGSMRGMKDGHHKDGGKGMKCKTGSAQEQNIKCQNMTIIYNNCNFNQDAANDMPKGMKNRKHNNMKMGMCKDKMDKMKDGMKGGMKMGMCKDKMDKMKGDMKGGMKMGMCKDKMDKMKGDMKGGMKMGMCKDKMDKMKGDMKGGMKMGMRKDKMDKMKGDMQHQMNPERQMNHMQNTPPTPINETEADNFTEVLEQY